jgi:uncharacterized membrane protein
VGVINVVVLWKLLIVAGLMMILLGTYLIKESKIIKQEGIKFENSHRIMNPAKYWVGIVFTVIGTILQIIGVIIS